MFHHFNIYNNMLSLHSFITDYCIILCKTEMIDGSVRARVSRNRVLGTGAYVWTRRAKPRVAEGSVVEGEKRRAIRRGGRDVNITWIRGTYVNRIPTGRIRAPSFYIASSHLWPRARQGCKICAPSSCTKRFPGSSSLLFCRHTLAAIRVTLCRHVAVRINCCHEVCREIEGTRVMDARRSRKPTLWELMSIYVIGTRPVCLLIFLPLKFFRQTDKERKRERKRDYLSKGKIWGESKGEEFEGNLCT